MTMQAFGWKYPFDQRTDEELANMARLMAQDIRGGDAIPADYVSWKPSDSQLAHFLAEVADRLRA